MTTSLSQQTKTKPDENEYLDSPKKFHLEMPLYFPIEINDKTEVQIYNLLHFSDTIDAYCIFCQKESVFYVHEYVETTFDQWRSWGHGYTRFGVSCTRNTDHKYVCYYYINSTKIVKMGQLPSVADFQIPQAEKYRRVLGDDLYIEFTKAIGLKAHGVGIGSFVYLRRIFENLINEAYISAKASPEFVESDYIKARMDDKIEILKGYLPVFLVENKKMYAILSKGIHELDELLCLKYFEAIKIGIEQILDEKIEKAEKIRKSELAKSAIQNITQEISNQVIK